MDQRRSAAKSKWGAKRKGTTALVLVLLGAGFAGCASQESLRAKQAAGTRLPCPTSELEVGLNRQTSRVREYYVGCEFTYMRIHCSDEHCAPAEPKPPCVGNMPCFHEDPVSLEWTLAQRER